MGKAAAATHGELEGQMSIDDILVSLGEPPVDPASVTPSAADGDLPVSARNES